jgi:hypothetical protein
MFLADYISDVILPGEKALQSTHILPGENALQSTPILPGKEDLQSKPILLGEEELHSKPTVPGENNLKSAIPSDIVHSESRISRERELRSADILPCETLKSANILTGSTLVRVLSTTPASKCPHDIDCAAQNYDDRYKTSSINRYKNSKSRKRRLQESFDDVATSQLHAGRTRGLRTRICKKPARYTS